MYLHINFYLYSYIIQSIIQYHVLNFLSTIYIYIYTNVHTFMLTIFI